MPVRRWLQVTSKRVSNAKSEKFYKSSLGKKKGASFWQVRRRAGGAAAAARGWLGGGARGPARRCRRPGAGVKCWCDLLRLGGWRASSPVGLVVAAPRAARVWRRAAPQLQAAAGRGEALALPQECKFARKTRRPGTAPQPAQASAHPPCCAATTLHPAAPVVQGFKKQLSAHPLIIAFFFFIMIFSGEWLGVGVGPSPLPPLLVQKLLSAGPGRAGSACAGQATVIALTPPPAAPPPRRRVCVCDAAAGAEADVRRVGRVESPDPGEEEPACRCRFA